MCEQEEKFIKSVKYHIRTKSRSNSNVAEEQRITDRLQHTRNRFTYLQQQQ